MAEFKGGCRCGAVRYVAEAEPIFTGVCHCTTCQKSTGSAFATVLAVPAATMQITGTTTQFDDKGDTGNATHRSFCPVCGSTVAQSADLMQGVTMIPVGSLDNPDIVKPAMQIYCDSALSWSKVPDMNGFPKMPMPG